ncbi:hypothetical protein BH18CHL1_BH18CHL1_04480 [soil metagenome]
MSSSAIIERDASARAGRFVTDSAAETRALGAAFAAAAMPGDRIALIGDLGAGKTQLAKGFATGLGVTEVVDSPSFTLMAEYEGRWPLFHQDLYRLSGAHEIVASGLLDERQDQGVTLLEWADRLDLRLDPYRLELRFAFAGEDGRIIESRCADAARHARYMHAGRAWEATTRGDR